MIFGIERKYVIAAAILTLTLGLGGILFWQKNPMGMGVAQISRVFDTGGWLEIKPRTGGASSTAAMASKNEPDKPKGKTAKPVIVWCAPSKAVATAKTVIINEVAWMGNAASYSDEWIELKNTTAADIDLAGWQLQNANKKIKVAFESGEILPAGGIYLLERADDETVPGVDANKIYSGSLGNSNETLYLFDNNCVAMDSVKSGAKWPAGDNKTKQTMARTAGLLWQASKVPGGTPGAENH